MATHPGRRYSSRHWILPYNYFLFTKRDHGGTRNTHSFTSLQFWSQHMNIHNVQKKIFRCERFVRVSIGEAHVWTLRRRTKNWDERGRGVEERAREGNGSRGIRVGGMRWGCSLAGWRGRSNKWTGRGWEEGINPEGGGGHAPDKNPEPDKMTCMTQQYIADTSCSEHPIQYVE